MAVGVVHRGVGVLMDMPSPDTSVVAVEMVPVGVDMSVRVDDRIVMVGVDMPLAKDGHGGGGHEQSRRGHRRPDPVAQDDNRGQGPDKGGQPEQRAGPESAQAPQSPDEEHQAQAVAERPNRQTGRGPRTENETMARGKSQG